jgi:tetratricopeptide (TPR) repeat protein
MRLVIDTLITRGTALSNVLRWREGNAILDAAIEMANANGLTAQWFRAINNILNHRMMLDPHAALELVTDGLVVARRLGDERWTQSLSGQLAFIGVRTGDWDALIADLERQLASANDPRSRSNAVDNLASLRAMQGLPVDEQLRELEATDALDQSAGSKMLLLDTTGWGHLAAGRMDLARDCWVQTYELDPTAGANIGPLLARLAIAANDPDTADRWQEIHWESVAHGGASEADHLALQAAIRGLRGDRAVAARDFREAARRYRELRLDIDEAIMAIDLVYVLGPTDPLTVDCVARARTTFATNHARAYLDRLDAAIGDGAHPVAGSQAVANSTPKAGVAT